MNCGHICSALFTENAYFALKGYERLRRDWRDGDTKSNDFQINKTRQWKAQQSEGVSYQQICL